MSAGPSVGGPHALVGVSLPPVPAAAPAAVFLGLGPLWVTFPAAEPVTSSCAPATLRCLTRAVAVTAAFLTARR